MLLVGAGLCVANVAAQTWSVTTADFQRIEGDLKAVDDAGVRVFSNASERTVPWEQLVAAEHPGVKRVGGADPFVVITRDGQRIVGVPVRFADDKLNWRSQMLGVLDLPIEDVAGVTQLAAEALPEKAGQEDLVVLVNGDQLRGIIEPDPEGGISVQQQGAATPTRVQWDNVKAVVLAQVGNAIKPRPAEPGRLRVRLVDGSVCLANMLHLDADQLHVQRATGELRLPVETIVSVVNDGGKVHFLAGMKPKESQYAPYMQISDQVPTALRVLDEVTADGRVYRGALQLRPKTSLVYTSNVDGRLHLRYACAHPGDLTDMAVKVLVNGTTVHEKQGVSSTTPSDAVEAPVKTGDTVTIEVGYGRNFDVQDWLLLLEAAFVAR
jgi:hypothetical protein